MLKYFLNYRGLLTIVFLAFLLLFLTQCNSFVKIIYGIKSPKVETEESLHKYLKRKKINTDNIYSISYEDLLYITKINNGSVINVMIFDSNNRLIKYKEDTACNATAFNFIENLTTDMEYTDIDSISLNNFLLKLKDFKGNPIQLEKTDDIDFYLFIFWAKYAGKLNKDHVKTWEKQANLNTKSKIKVFKVNLDMQKWWEESLEK